jgi:hypothetical protein
MILTIQRLTALDFPGAFLVVSGQRRQPAEKSAGNISNPHLISFSFL